MNASRICLPFLLALLCFNLVTVSVTASDNGSGGLIPNGTPLAFNLHLCLHSAANSTCVMSTNNATATCTTPFSVVPFFQCNTVGDATMTFANQPVGSFQAMWQQDTRTYIQYGLVNFYTDSACGFAHLIGFNGVGSMDTAEGAALDQCTPYTSTASPLVINSQPMDVWYFTQENPTYFPKGAGFGLFQSPALQFAVVVATTVFMIFAQVL